MRIQANISIYYEPDDDISQDRVDAVVERIGEIFNKESPSTETDWYDGMTIGCSIVDDETKSSCCNAPVRVVGRTTQYYECCECGKACDVKDAK